MKLFFKGLVLWGTLWFFSEPLKAASESGTFLVLLLRGQVEYLSQVDLLQRVDSPRTWRKVTEHLMLGGGCRLRTGENAAATLWLRPWGRLSVDEKSVVEIVLRNETNINVNSATLLDGRVGLEITRFEEETLYEIRISQVQSRLSEGKMGASWERDSGIAQFFQWEGVSYASPILENIAGSNRINLKKMILPFNEMKLPKGQRLAFKDLRSTMRSLENVPGPEWQFMFKRPREKSDSPFWLESRVDFP